MQEVGHNLGILNPWTFLYDRIRRTRLTEAFYVKPVWISMFSHWLTARVKRGILDLGSPAVSFGGAALNSHSDTSPW